MDTESDKTAMIALTIETMTIETMIDAIFHLKEQRAASPVSIASAVPAAWIGSFGCRRSLTATQRLSLGDVNPANAPKI